MESLVTSSDKAGAVLDSGTGETSSSLDEDDDEEDDDAVSLGS